MSKWTTIILLAIALIACTSAQTNEDRQGKGKKPVKVTDGNKNNPPAGATPPPLKSNKAPGDAKQGPVKVDRSGTKEEKKYVMSSGGFNVETNGEAHPSKGKKTNPPESKLLHLAPSLLWRIPTNHSLSEAMESSALFPSRLAFSSRRREAFLSLLE
jgi:hypothetical protein